MTTSNNDMQISIKHPTLLEIAKNQEDNTESEQLSDEDSLHVLLKPVRLSVFSKELKEAENEPIPDVQYINEPDDTDETDNKDDSVLEYLSDSIDVAGNKIEFADKQTSLLEYNEECNSTNINKSLNRTCEEPKSANLNSSYKRMVTPVSKVYVNNFLTPNLVNLKVKPYVNSYFTQIQDKNRIKLQNDRESNLKTTFENRTTLTKTSLFPVSNRKSNLKDIYEDRLETENKENRIYDTYSNEDPQKILCTIQMEKPILDPFEKITVNKVEYVILNQIGRGGSSIIFHCFDINEKCDRAIKRVNLIGDSACVNGYINEVKMLHKLQSCNRIIKMYAYEIVENKKVLLMVLEKGEKDLATILKALSLDTNHLPMYMLIYYWMEMLYAVKQIHENGIIHSDLKPANFLMVSTKLKLIDFGIASSIQSDMTSVLKDVQIGSFNYISPEALINNSQDSETAKFKISYKTDVWSLGCILYQLVYNKTPFKHIGHTYAKLSAIIDPNHVIEYENVDWIPENVIQTIKSCLRYDMKLRPSVDDLIKQFENIYY